MAVFFILIVIFLAVFSALYYFTGDSICLTILMLTPAISVVFTKLICKQSFKDLYIKPNIKGNVKWYLSAYFLTPVIAFTGAIIYFLIFRTDLDVLGSKYAMGLGVTNTKEYVTTLLFTIPLAVIVNPIMGIVQCFGEELAWRSFLLPRLNKRFSIRTAVLLDGVIWGVWHSPIIAMGYNYGTEYPFLGIAAMIVFCVVIGIISSFLFYKTKSVWCPVVFHAAINGMDKFAPSDLFMSKDANPFIGPDLLGIIGSIGFVVIAMVMFYKMENVKEA